MGDWQRRLLLLLLLRHDQSKCAYAYAMVKSETDTGSGLGMLSDASSTVWSSSSELPSGELKGRLVSMRSARQACQLLTMQAILCRHTRERHFHHALPLAVIAEELVNGGRMGVEVRWWW